MSRQKTQRRIHWAAYLWPGLPHLWIAGSWAGLVLAFGFAVLVNLMILATLVWPEWLPPRVKLGCGILLGVIWLAAAWETRAELKRIAARREREDSGESDPVDLDREQADLLLRQAQTEFLAENWVAAERTLQELLRLDRRDVEGLLLLATLWRHCGRFDDAESQLSRLERLEEATMWEFEIRREWEQINVARQSQSPAEPLPPSVESSPIAA